ncbi:MAG TPA: hypothetical protein VMG12_14670 [Polyangiaceae bacterium]|nr:hypothetical protein [Polyangiaceae bacterium]
MPPPFIRVVSSSSDRYLEETIAALPSPFRRAIDDIAATRWVRRGALGLGLVALLAFSVAWVWRVGHRGVFMLDQSIVFDGAWRMFEGQVPYRDFVMPFGPVVFALCALMFRAAGVDFSTLVLTAALMSLLATALSVRVSWLLSQRSGALTLLGGFLTAVWFQAPFGTPWMEQTGFLMDLIALSAIVEARLAWGPEKGSSDAALDRALPLGWLPSGWAWYALAGVASVAAVLSKQNAGGLFVFLCLGMLWVPGDDGPRAGWRATLFYGLGGAAAAGAFVTWLVTRSDFSTFRHYWVEVSAEIGASRVVYWKVLGTLVFQPLLSSSIPLFGLASLVGLVTVLLMNAGRPASGVATRVALNAWLCLALPQFHSLFQLTTNNDASNNNAFVGLVVVCLIASIAHWLRQAPSVSFRDRGERVRVPLVRPGLMLGLGALIGVLTLYSAGEGLMVADGRFVQEFAPGATFDERLQVPGAERVQWGEPTRITPQFCSSLGDMCKISSASTALDHSYETLRRQDFEQVARRLRERGGNFFVFPDATMLYGLTGHPSPQPLLYFHPGQSYAIADQAELDRTIVAALEQHHVRSIVLERASFMGTHKLLAEFPQLDAWIARNFELSEEIGNYHLFDAREAAPSAALR